MRVLVRASVGVLSLWAIGCGAQGDGLDAPFADEGEQNAALTRKGRVVGYLPTDQGGNLLTSINPDTGTESTMLTLPGTAGGTINGRSAFSPFNHRLYFTRGFPSFRIVTVNPFAPSLDNDVPVSGPAKPPSIEVNALGALVGVCSTNQTSVTAFCKIDPVSGVTAILNPNLGVSSNLSDTPISALNLMSNRYYWLTHPSSAQRLVTIDAATGAVLANIPIPLTFSSQMRMITLRINATGQLMAMASDGSVTKVARIDPANGAVAVLESLEGTVSAPLSHALYNAIDQIANRLYYVVYDPSTTGNVIYTMNATTGAILDVAPLAVGWAWPAHLEVIF